VKLVKQKKWETKKADWEVKKEKFLADPEQRKEKLESIDSKLNKLEERKQWLQTRLDDANPCSAARLAHIIGKINRLESFKTMLVGLDACSATVVDSTSIAEPIAEPIPEAHINPNVTEEDLNAAKEASAVFVNELNDIHLKLQTKKDEFKALKAQIRSSGMSCDEDTDKINQMKKELDELRIAHKDSKAALQAHYAQIRVLRQNLPARKKAPKQESH